MVSLSLKGLTNIATIGLFMNIYEQCILVLDEEPCKMQVLKQKKRLMMIIIIIIIILIIVDYWGHLSVMFFGKG